MGKLILLMLMRGKGLKVVGVGTSKRPKTIECDLNYVNFLNVYETAAIMSRATSVIGHEGLIGHLAQAMELPAVLLYGITSPQYVNEKTDLLETVISPVACQGCRHVKQAGTSIVCSRNYIYLLIKLLL